MRRANGRTTHQPQVPDHVALPRLPSKSSAKKGGKGQRGEGQGQISKQETSTEEQSSPKQRNVNVLERSRRGRGAAGTGPRGREAGASPRSTPLRCRAAPAPGPKQGEAKQGGRWVQEAGTGQPGVPARQRPARWRGTYQCVPREHLQQRDEVVSIPQVLVEVVDVALRLQGREAALPGRHARHQLPLAAPAPLRRALARERQGEPRTPPPQGARTRPAWCPTAGPAPGPASPYTHPQAHTEGSSLPAPQGPEARRVGCRLLHARGPTAHRARGHGAVGPGAGEEKQ